MSLEHCGDRDGQIWTYLKSEDQCWNRRPGDTGKIANFYAFERERGRSRACRSGEGPADPSHRVRARIRAGDWPGDAVALDMPNSSVVSLGPTMPKFDSVMTDWHHLPMRCRHSLRPRRMPLSASAGPAPVRLLEARSVSVAIAGSGAAAVCRSSSAGYLLSTPRRSEVPASPVSAIPLGSAGAARAEEVLAIARELFQLRAHGGRLCPFGRARGRCAGSIRGYADLSGRGDQSARHCPPCRRQSRTACFSAPISRETGAPLGCRRLLAQSRLAVCPVKHPKEIRQLTGTRLRPATFLYVARLVPSYVRAACCRAPL